jgi:zinc D-Ala-D-Ala dipeptidase
MQCLKRPGRWSGFCLLWIAALLLLAGALLPVGHVTSAETEHPLLLSHLSEPSDDLQERGEALLNVLTSLEKELLELGLVDVRSLDPTLLVDLKYARSDNFMGADVYGELRRALLVPAAAEMLRQAHDHLKLRHPDYRLLVVDAFRPRRVQYLMWERVQGTAQQPYVANPASGSMHNYGAAVDITIVDAQGKPLDMGTPVDHFGILSQVREEERFLREGRLTPEQVANRRLLRAVMEGAGFIQLPIEWWHFDAFERKVVRTAYRIID